MHGPPILPPHLLQIILNKDTPLSVSTVLVLQNVLKVRILSCSHSYKRKKGFEISAVVTLEYSQHITRVQSNSSSDMSMQYENKCVDDLMTLHTEEVCFV